MNTMVFDGNRITWSGNRRPEFSGELPEIDGGIKNALNLEDFCKDLCICPRCRKAAAGFDNYRYTGTLQRLFSCPEH